MPTLANVSIKDNSSWTTMLNMIYPVGSYYISNSSTTPASRFGGTWSSVTGAHFLRANASNGSGNASSHSHSLSSGYGMFRHDFTNNPNIQWREKTATFSGAGHLLEWSSWGRAQSATLGANQSNALRLGGNTSTSSSIIPAYKDVYCWYRTA